MTLIVAVRSLLFLIIVAWQVIYYFFSGCLKAALKHPLIKENIVFICLIYLFFLAVSGLSCGAWDLC